MLQIFWSISCQDRNPSRRLRSCVSFSTSHQHFFLLWSCGCFFGVVDVTSFFNYTFWWAKSLTYNDNDNMIHMIWFDYYFIYVLFIWCEMWFDMIMIKLFEILIWGYRIKTRHRRDIDIDWQTLRLIFLVDSTPRAVTVSTTTTKEKNNFQTLRSLSAWGQFLLNNLFQVAPFQERYTLWFCACNLRFRKQYEKNKIYPVKGILTWLSEAAATTAP